MIEKKVPPYAPYIMKLILDKMVDEDSIEDEIVFEGMVPHQRLKLYKKHMVATTQGQDTSTPSGDLGGNCYASGSRRKNVDPPSGQMGSEFKKLKWWPQAMFCTKTMVCQTQYKDYLERKNICTKQHTLDARLRILEKGKGQALKLMNPSKPLPSPPSPLVGGMKVLHLIGKS
jgi:hypothetical protein